MIVTTQFLAVFPQENRWILPTHLTHLTAKPYLFIYLPLNTRM